MKLDYILIFGQRIGFGLIFEMYKEKLIMKKIGILSILTIAFAVSFAFKSSDNGEVGKKVPSVKLEDLDGNLVNSGEITNDGNPIVISFWATWCKPCIQELDVISESYDDLVEETGVKLIAVSIDDERNKSKVRPQVDSKGWDYEVWLDCNSELKRAMGVGIPPQTFLIDGSGNIVYSHTGYVVGDEEKLYEEIRKHAKK